MKKKILSFILFVLLAVSCAFILTACDFFGGDGKADPNLYELTVTSNINLQLGNQKGQLRAEFARERDNDEIEELLNAGATQEDIDKAGKLNNGKYYFFDQDPINVYAPVVDYYKFIGFYIKNVFQPYEHVITNGERYAFFNMDNKATTIEARYEPLTYTVHYTVGEGQSVNQTVANDGLYNALTGGEITLNSPIAPNGATFTKWYYHNQTSEPGVEPPRVYCTTLPRSEIALCEGSETLVLFAEYEYQKYTLTFDFMQVVNVDEKEPLDTETAWGYIDSIKIRGNLTTVGGQPTVDTQGGVEVNANSVIKTQINSWMEIFITNASGYKACKYILNGKEHTIYYDAAPQITIEINKITKDTTITIVFAYDIQK